VRINVCLSVNKPFSSIVNYEHSENGHIPAPGAPYKKNNGTLLSSIKKVEESSFIVLLEA
jgi:hypothetical protein